jgi:hypothetical protein
MADCTLTDGTTTITLPDDRYLVPDPDEDESGVRMDLMISGAGTVIVQTSTQDDGWEIALTGEAPVARSTVRDLNTLARQAGQMLTLTLPDARVFSVLFRQPQWLEKRPLFDYVPAELDEPIQITLYFITKAP